MKKGVNKIAMSLFFPSFGINFVIADSEGVLFSAPSCAKWRVNWPMDLSLYFYFFQYFQMTLMMRNCCLKWMLPKLSLILQCVLIWFKCEFWNILVKFSCKFALSWRFLLYFLQLATILSVKGTLAPNLRLRACLAMCLNFLWFKPEVTLKTCL